MQILVDQSHVVAVVGRVDDPLERIVEGVGQRVETDVAQWLEQRDVLRADQHVGRVAVDPHQLLGAVEVDVVVAVDVDVLEAGDRVGDGQQIEQVVRDVGRTVVLHGDVEHPVGVVGGSGVLDVVDRPDSAVLALGVRHQDERQVGRGRRPRGFAVLQHPFGGDHRPLGEAHHHGRRRRGGERRAQRPQPAGLSDVRYTREVFDLVTGVSGGLRTEPTLQHVGHVPLQRAERGVTGDRQDICCQIDVRRYKSAGSSD